jgi:hypothetical protein
MQARLRPLYQVSDEVQYVFGAQQAAVSQPSTPQGRCISPPDGSLLVAGRGGGKWAFQAVTAYQLTQACRDGGAFPLFVLRAFSALSLPVLVGSAWVLARTVWPARLDVAILAGLLVAVHPVLVKYGSGITPDAWANALAGVAFVAGARVLVGRARWFDGVALLAATGIALVWKETSTFLLAHLALVAAITVWRVVSRASPAWRMLSLALGVVLIAGGATMTTARLLAFFGSTYEVGAGLGRTLRDPVAFAAATAADLLPRLPGMIATSWTVLGNFGGTTVAPVPGATAVAVLTVAAAILGWAAIFARPRADLRPLAGVLALVWGASALLCLLQPSVRQVWVGSQDVHQGRWLFPLAAPVAAIVAAGVVRLRPAPGWIALPGVLWLGVMWITLGHLGHWYYARVPDEVIRAHVFTRATGGHDVGDARIWAVLGDLARQQVPAFFWWQAALLCASTLVTLWFLSASSSASGHDRHPSYR